MHLFFMSPNMIVYSLLTEKKNHLPFSTFFVDFFR